MLNVNEFFFLWELVICNLYLSLRQHFFIKLVYFISASFDKSIKYCPEGLHLSQDSNFTDKLYSVVCTAHLLNENFTVEVLHSNQYM